MPVLWHLVSFLSCTWIFCFCLDVHKPGLLHTVYVSEVCAYCPSEMCQHNKTTLDQIPQGVKGRKCRKAWEGLVAMSRLDEELQVTGSTALQWGNRLSCVPLRQEKQWVLCGALIGCPMQPLMDFGLFSCTINRYSGFFFHVTLITSVIICATKEGGCTLPTCLFYGHGWTCRPFSITIRTFLKNALEELLTTFSPSTLSTSHILAKVVKNTKVICYDATSLMLVYLLMLAVFPYEAQVVIDLKAVKAEPAAWSLISLVQKTRGLSTVRMTNKPEKASGLSVYPAPVIVNGRQTCWYDRELQYPVSME